MQLVFGAKTWSLLLAVAAYLLTKLGATTNTAPVNPSPATSSTIASPGGSQPVVSPVVVPQLTQPVPAYPLSAPTSAGNKFSYIDGY